MQKKAEGGVSYHVIRSTHDVTGSGHKDIFTHIIWQPFGAISSSSDMFRILDAVLRQLLSCLHS